MTPLEFDHLFICTQVGAPEIEGLLAAGFTEGSSNLHPGQGTTNRRIFFHNMMLEFLWVINDQEVQSPAIALTKLWERWQHQQTGYSPFGIALRPGSQPAGLPFTTWAFHPPYLPPHLQMDVAAGTAPEEPFIVVIPFGGRPDTFPTDRRQPLAHPNGVYEMTQLAITLPLPKPFSTAVQSLQEAGLITFKSGDESLAEVTFDHGKQGQSIDLRPHLPLCLFW